MLWYVELLNGVWIRFRVDWKGVVSYIIVWCVQQSVTCKLSRRIFYIIENQS